LRLFRSALETLQILVFHHSVPVVSVDRASAERKDLTPPLPLPPFPPPLTDLQDEVGGDAPLVGLGVLHHGDLDGGMKLKCANVNMVEGPSLGVQSQSHRKTADSG
jgi:hypothetical protein